MKKEKYWITSGVEVRHKVFDQVMIVDKIVRRSSHKDGEPSKVFIEGVRCYWIDKEGKHQTGMFHTKHLSLVKVN